jgi:hypothetical protein
MGLGILEDRAMEHVPGMHLYRNSHDNTYMSAII